MEEEYPEIEWVNPLRKYDSTAEAAEWEDEKIVAEDRELIDTCDAILIHYEKVPSHGTPREQEYVRHLGEMADFIEALEKYGALDSTIEAALDEIDKPWPKHLPIVVQTTADELSPWLTVDAYAVEESFDGAVRRLKGALSGLYPQLREA